MNAPFLLFYYLAAGLLYFKVVHCSVLMDSCEVNYRIILRYHSFKTCIPNYIVLKIF